jgi:dTMP kinase
MWGRFITLEGGEGAGKSTQVRLLAEHLGASGLPVTVTREPGGTPRAEAIRAFLLSGRAEPLGPEGEAVLFSAARADHVERLIRPALARGRWVISDRFADSTRAYQQAAGGVDPRIVRALERLAVGWTKPDITLILDLPAELGLARMAARAGGEGGAGGPDRFERDAVELHERRRQAFLAIAEAEPGRCVVIDAAQETAAVAEVVRNAVSARLLAAA